jgi:hypothetical protein
VGFAGSLAGSAGGELAVALEDIRLGPETDVRGKGGRNLDFGAAAAGARAHGAADAEEGLGGVDHRSSGGCGRMPAVSWMRRRYVGVRPSELHRCKDRISRRRACVSCET